MYKLLTYAPYSSHGQHFVPINFGGWTKQASHLEQYWSPEVLDFIKKGDFDTSGDSLVTLTNVVSAGEYYGPNNNGDWFGKEALAHDGLDFGYKTFEKYGHVFLHHINKDPNQAAGKVVYAHYNPRMHRVETIDIVDKDKAGKFAEQIENGQYPSVSMGCKVPFDLCSICGNKAEKIAYYCPHLKHEMNKIMPGGKQVYAINTEPKFFDRSYVLVGADRTAGHLAKVASQKLFYVPSAYAALEVFGEDDGTEKIASESPEDRPVQGNSSGQSLIDLQKEAFELFRDRVSPKLAQLEPTLDYGTIQKVAEYNWDSITATTTAMGMVLKPQEFAAIELEKGGHQKQAREVLKTSHEDLLGLVDEVDVKEASIDIEDADPKIAEDMGSYARDRTVFEPHFSDRVMRSRDFFEEKTASVLESLLSSNYIKDLAGVILAYLAYRQAVPNTSLKSIEGFFKKNPKALLPLLGGTAVAHGMLFGQDEEMPAESPSAPTAMGAPAGAGVMGHPLQGLPVAMPKYSMRRAPFEKKANGFKTVVLPIGAAYLASNYMQNRKRHGERLGEIESFIANNPLIVGSLGAIGANQLSKVKGYLGSNLPKTAAAIALDEAPLEFLRSFERSK